MTTSHAAKGGEMSITGEKGAFNPNLDNLIEPFKGLWLVIAIEEIDNRNVAVPPKGRRP
jgi:hypothetical protein